MLPAPRGREEEEEKNIRKPAVPTVNTNILKSNVSALNERIITQNSKDSLSIVAEFSDVTDDSPRLQSVAWKKWLIIIVIIIILKLTNLHEE